MPVGFMHFLACLALIAVTAGSQSKPPNGSDRLVLRDGTVLRGRIVAESAASVTLALGSGTRVEFRKRDLARFERRGADLPAGGSEAAKSNADDRTEERFLVYLGDRPVGFRTVVRARITRRGTAGTLYREEVTFPDRPEQADAGDRGDRTCRVVTLEFVADGGGLRTLYYREVGMGTDYIIDAVLRGEQLEYTWLRGGKRTLHRETVPPRTGFPVSSWFEAAAPRAQAGAVGGASRVFDPHTRAFVVSGVRRFGQRVVPVGSGKFKVTPVVVRGARGARLRWLGADGRTLKEHLNGVSLVAVATAMRGFPASLDQSSRPDQREAELLRVCLDPQTGLVLRAPAAGWTRSASPASGASFTLRNREMRTSIAVYWSGSQDQWPGPELPSGVSVRPIAFGGWPGEGWTTKVPGVPGFERVVRRRRTAAGSVTAVLDTPQEFASAAAIDFAALLRGTYTPVVARAPSAER